MDDSLDLTTLAKELRTLETETFEIQDYTETGDLLTAHKMEPCSCSSCTSTCSSTTSCTSCCA
ncbi:lantibiotic protein [Embleya sp. AB8]|uniref:lantibiotic protein n=1 Tax=Embleya sp. AB8 TaxID=3156304 RepID=UPI003C74B5BF